MRVCCRRASPGAGGAHAHTVAAVPGAMSSSSRRLRVRGVVSAAAAPAPPALALGALPPELALAVLLRLPLRERVAAEAVCRGWRCALRAPALWTALDLSPLGNGASDDVALLLARRAAGRLRSLDASNCANLSVPALLNCAELAGGHADAALAIRAPSAWWSSKQARARLSRKRGGPGEALARALAAFRAACARVWRVVRRLGSARSALNKTRLGFV